MAENEKKKTEKPTSAKLKIVGEGLIRSVKSGKEIVFSGTYRACQNFIERSKKQ